MKKYINLLIATLTLSAPAAWATDREVISNFYFLADVVETPRELVIRNISVGYHSSVFGPQITTWNIPRSENSANQPVAKFVASLCPIYGASKMVSYSAHDLRYGEMVLSYQEVGENSYDYFWARSHSVVAISQVICRK